MLAIRYYSSKLNEFREQISEKKPDIFKLFALLNTPCTISIYFGVLCNWKLCTTSIQIRTEVANIYKKANNFFVLIVNKYNIFRKH